MLQVGSIEEVDTDRGGGGGWGGEEGGGGGAPSSRMVGPHLVDPAPS